MDLGRFLEEMDEAEEQLDERDAKLAAARQAEFRRTDVAKVIRELYKQGKTNAEIKKMAPRILRERRSAHRTR